MPTPFLENLLGERMSNWKKFWNDMNVLAVSFLLCGCLTGDQVIVEKDSKVTQKVHSIEKAELFLRIFLEFEGRLIVAEKVTMPSDMKKQFGLGLIDQKIYGSQGFPVVLFSHGEQIELTFSPDGSLKKRSKNKVEKVFPLFLSIESNTSLLDGSAKFRLNIYHSFLLEYPDTLQYTGQFVN